MEQADLVLNRFFSREVFCPPERRSCRICISIACRTPHRKDALIQEAEGRSKAWYHGVWIVVSLEGASGDGSTG